MLATVGNHLYAKTSPGTLCTDKKDEITSESECKQAAEHLGLPWASSWNGPNDFPACLYTADRRNRVYFNLSPNPARTNVKKYSAICRVKSISSKQNKCNGGSKPEINDCCTKNSPCDIGQGDCDDDHDCKGNLICGKDNCDTSKFKWGKADCCAGK